MLGSPGQKVRHKSGSISVLSHRKEDGSGWWLVGTGGIADWVMEGDDWELLPDEPVGVAATVDLANAVTNSQLCTHGWHAWVPWLQLENGSWVTWCAREGCDHQEQYDT